MKKHELELDYLAPFLAQIGDPAHISRQEAYKLKEECLQDLKHRLIDKANLIQARFEKVCIMSGRHLLTGSNLSMKWTGSFVNKYAKRETRRKIFWKTLSLIFISKQTFHIVIRLTYSLRCYLMRTINHLLTRGT